MIVENVTEAIGGTPLLKADRIKDELGLYANIYLKMEAMNPAGSIKDRAALYMILDAEEKGLLKPGGTIIEPTSGNTGIGLASIGSSRGYRTIFVLPETMSVERRKLLKAYGAEVVLTPAEKGMKGSIEEAERIKENTPGSIIPGQFVNPANARAHYETTAPEIYSDLDGKVDMFFAGIGTGGTVTGCGKYLKEKNPDIEIIAIEPANSPVISEGKSGSHNLQGLGANFVPDILDLNVIDRIQPVLEEPAYETARLLAKKEGFLVGISSGAALFAAIEEAKKEENKGKNIVVILPDTGERYLSTELFNI